MQVTNKSFSNHIAGVWNLTLALPIGKREVKVEIDIAEGNCYGRATSQGQTVALEDVTVDGKSIKWHQRVDKPIRMTIIFDLVFEGDEISGKCKPGMFPHVAVSGRRISRAEIF